MIKFKIISIFIFTGLLSALSQTKDSLQTKWTTKNCVNQFTPEKATPTKTGYQYWFADKNFTNGKTLKISVVKPNQSTHAPHKHIEDEYFFILEGKAKCYLNGDSVIVEPYASFLLPIHVGT